MLHVSHAKQHMQPVAGHGSTGVSLTDAAYGVGDNLGP